MKALYAVDMTESDADLRAASLKILVRFLLELLVIRELVQLLV